MHFLHGLAGFFLFFELPIPVYWLILHPFGPFWRTRVRSAFWIAGLSAWVPGGVILWEFRHRLLTVTPPPWYVVAVGLALIGIEIYLFLRVERELGTRRLIGHAELTGSGEFFASGLYAHVRHPRYTGMFCAVAGAGLIAGRPLLWAVLAVWWVIARLVIGLEERELTARFGAAYTAYRQHVPAFLPFQLLSRGK